MPKQDDLAGVEGPGVSQPKIKAIDEQFDILIGAREKRMSWGKKEKDAQTELVALMEKHGVEVYMYDETPYMLKDIKKVVRKPKDDEEPEA